MFFTIGIIIFLVLGGLNGYRTGLLRQLSGLISILLAAVFAMYYSHDVTSWVTQVLVKYLDYDVSVSKNYLTYVVVFATLMIVVSTVFQGIGRWLNGFNRWPIFGLGNSILGILAGLVIQYLVIFIVINMLLSTQLSWVHQQYNTSQLAQIIVKVKTN